MKGRKDSTYSGEKNDVTMPLGEVLGLHFPLRAG